MEIPNKPNTVTSAEVKKFNDEEMKELVAIRQGYEKVTLALGQLQIEKRDIEKNEKAVLVDLEKTEARESVFLQKILEKYGEGTVNQETGIFTPKKS